MPLNYATSRWRVFLRDDDGHLLSPAKIEPINQEQPIYLYLLKYFEGVNRWATLFRVSFPKLKKSVTGLSRGDHAV